MVLKEPADALEVQERRPILTSKHCKGALKVKGKAVGVAYSNRLPKSELALVTARANRFSDSAALFAALGGGWWRRHDTDTNL